MPPSRVKTDDIIEAILDQRVIDAISKSLMPLIALTIEEAMDKKLRSILGDITTLKKESITHRTEIGTLQKTITGLKHTERDMREKLEALEAYQRSDNVVIRGLTESTYAEASSQSTDCDVTGIDRGETSQAAE